VRTGLDRVRRHGGPLWLRKVRVAMRCGFCGSSDINISVREWDFGRCSETGYHDAGEEASFYCNSCGKVGDCEGDMLRESDMEASKAA
jgi:hypothetical protein